MFRYSICLAARFAAINRCPRFNTLRYACLHSKCVHNSQVMPRLYRLCLGSNTAHYSQVTTGFETLAVQDSSQFETQVLVSLKPVILQFHATWCQPCKILAAVLERKIADKNVDVLYAKVDIDSHTELAMEYGVVSVPTVMAIKNGKVTDKMIGLQDGDIVKSFVDKAVE